MGDLYQLAPRRLRWCWCWSSWTSASLDSSHFLFATSGMQRWSICNVDVQVRLFSSLKYRTSVHYVVATILSLLCLTCFYFCTTTDPGVLIRRATKTVSLWRWSLWFELWWNTFREANGRHESKSLSARTGWLRVSSCGTVTAVTCSSHPGAGTAPCVRIVCCSSTTIVLGSETVLANETIIISSASFSSVQWPSCTRSCSALFR